jgi:hypothetical protein
VLAGLLSIAVAAFGPDIVAQMGGKVWQWQMGLLLLPIAAYGVLLFGQSFPKQERVAAGVSYRTMLEEFGWGSAYIVSFLLIMGVSQLFTVLEMEPIRLEYAALGAIAPAALFAFFVHSFGRPMFVFLLLVMFLLATTELGTDAWIQDIMGAVLKDPAKGTYFLIYTSAIMFVLRFFAGPIVHRISPLGLLALSAALAVGGLYALGTARPDVTVLLAAATLYGLGKSFFWPTTLGVVSEQYPRGGALLLNAIAGVGMISVGTIGGPAIGSIQDSSLNQIVAEEMPSVHPQIAKEQSGLFEEYEMVDPEKVKTLPQAQQDQIADFQRQTKQQTLTKIAILPAIMCVCYLALIFYFQSRGGYQAEVLTGHAADDEKFTGGVPGPVEG